MRLRSKIATQRLLIGVGLAAVVSFAGCTAAESTPSTNAVVPVRETATPRPSAATTVAQTAVNVPTTSTALSPVVDETQTQAACVSGTLQYQSPGRRDEVALYQQTLKNNGYYFAEVDGLFGPATLNAAMAEIRDNGVIVDSAGEFVDVNTDDATILPPTFERLTIACQ